MNILHRLGIHTGKYTPDCLTCRQKALRGLRATFRQRYFTERSVPSPFEREKLREVIDRSRETISQHEVDEAWQRLLGRAKR